MKKLRLYRKIVCVLLSAVILFCVPSIFCGCIGNNIYDGELLRLHIRANSNSQVDQEVKLKVRDAVNDYIERNVKKSTFAEAYADIGARLLELDAIATETLRKNGFSYSAKSKLVNEYFPARKYGDTVVPDGYYDALIIELGEAKGDNWWCVVYPPLCYGEGEKFEYKSFFAELFG